ncbi:hypothetical protein BS47DRAFT_1490051 [Hydnum rufescens UP504]|uniref:DUF6532 domain-containing protein n=1 Tax=Hydnum rufescens UP504 TaxID=1448309 RepID=A0A9P6DN07_9AGAM|nr:hypothetical protein BS47DRAFT_1490051 [Hydnum rufescens UP504]
MPAGTRLKLGIKKGKRIDPDNTAESPFPKPVSETVQVRRKEAAVKAAATRHANKLLKKAAANAKAHNGDGEAKVEDSTTFNSANTVPSPYIESTDNLEESYAAKDAIITERWAKEDEEQKHHRVSMNQHPPPAGHASSGNQSVSAHGSKAHNEPEDTEVNTTIGDDVVENSDNESETEHEFSPPPSATSLKRTLAMLDVLRPEQQEPVNIDKRVHLSAKVTSAGLPTTQTSSPASGLFPLLKVPNSTLNLGTRRHVSSPQVVDPKYPNDNNETKHIPASVGGKRTTMKMLKNLNLSPGFSLAVSNAQHDFHIFILTKSMFPSDMDAHTSILASVRCMSHEQGIVAIEVDDVFYKTLMHDASTFQSWFKTKAQNTLPHLYGFHGKDKDTVQSIVAAALDFQCYRYEFFKGHPEMPHKNALCHPAIWAILSVFFESPETKVASAVIMPAFATMPIEAIAFALTVIHDTLSSWKTGVHEKQSLSAPLYTTLYQNHVLWIQAWKEKPTQTEEWKKISERLGSAAFRYRQVPIEHRRSDALPTDAREDAAVLDYSAHWEQMPSGDVMPLYWEPVNEAEVSIVSTTFEKIAQEKLSATHTEGPPTSVREVRRSMFVDVGSRFEHTHHSVKKSGAGYKGPQWAPEFTA